MDPSELVAVRDGLSRFDGPTLIVWGTDDVFFPVSLGRRVAEAFPKSTFQPVPKAKLFVAIDQPDVVAKAIGAFADRESSAVPLAIG